MNDLPDDIPDPPMHWDRLGVPISLREWADLMEDREYRRIAWTEVGNVIVSTVWMGISAEWNPAMFFETAVLGPEGTSVVARYPTEAVARDGHAMVVNDMASRPI